MKSHTMNDIDTTSPHCHFDGRSGAAKSHPPWYREHGSRKSLGSGFPQSPKSLPAIPPSIRLRWRMAGTLPSENFHVKKGCEEMISIFSQSLSMISFRNPHGGRSFASILPPAIYVPQTWTVFPASTGMDRRKTSVVFLKSSRCRTPIRRHIISPAGV